MSLGNYTVDQEVAIFSFILIIQSISYTHCTPSIAVAFDVIDKVLFTCTFYSNYSIKTFIPNLKEELHKWIKKVILGSANMI